MLIDAKKYIPDNASFQWALYAQQRSERNHRFEVSGKVNSQAPFVSLLEGGTLLAADYEYEGGISGLILKEGDALLRFSAEGNEVRAQCSADSAELARSTLEGFLLRAPLWQDPAKGKIRVGFWSNSQHGPKRTWRTLDSADAAVIPHNYLPRVTDAINELAGIAEPHGLGRLILLHGIPGTGKTFLIRMLAEAWKNWCNTEYVIDPDAMLQIGSYVSDVVFSNSIGWDPEDVPEQKWKLIVIEDASEFIERDAHNSTGQGLARLLNIADGFIGQSTNTLILITTNEPLDKLHPAVTRAGRCLANIHFDALGVDQANDWLKLHAVEKSVSKATTLAELYEMKGTARIGSQKAERKLGFGN